MPKKRVARFGAKNLSESKFRSFDWLARKDFSARAGRTDLLDLLSIEPWIVRIVSKQKTVHHERVIVVARLLIHPWYHHNNKAAHTK